MGTGPVKAGVGASRAVAALRARGVDPGPVLERAGFPGSDLAGAAPVAKALIIEFAAEAAGDPIFGLRLADEVAPHDLGLVYFLARSAPTLRDALRLFTTFLTAAGVGLEAHLTDCPDGAAALEVRFPSAFRDRLRHTVEYQCALVVRVSRAIAGPFDPMLVAFAHPRHDAAEAVERYFGCPVRFGADADRIVFGSCALDRPLLAADPNLMSLLHGVAESAGQSRERKGIRAAVEDALRPRLATRQTTVAPVAQALGMAPRTLIRRLAEEGVAFSEILAEMRAKLAIQHLGDKGGRERSVDEIAALLGYRDVAAFSRAFRRWTGVAPTVLRDNRRRARRVVETDEGGGGTR